MPISKRMRFEVLRRDGYACRYCGAKAPDVVLHVDHVIPEALGGSDEPSNLATSCEDCNQGKTSTVPDAPTVADVDDRALRWRLARQQAALESITEPDGLTAAVNTTASVFESWYELDGQELEAIRRVFERGLPPEQMVRAAEIARYNTRVAKHDAFRYFMGVCNRMLEQIDARARAIMATEDAQDDKR